MANEAFALSPISARAARPDEADYEAIREAFMETARGRWFLGEYAKRNRNSDTRMVLDEVARIERTLETLQQSLPDTRLTEILATITNLVDEAAEMAASAADGLAIEERLAPVRRGARILKAISWRWREIGTESRICDSIDSQVEAIQKSCSQLARIDTRIGLTAAFKLMRARIEALAEENGVAVPPAANPAAEFDSAAARVQAASEDEILACTLAPDEVVSIQTASVAAAVARRAEPADVQEEALLGIVALELAALDARDPRSRGNAGGTARVEAARSEIIDVAAQIESAPTEAWGYALATAPERPAVPPSPLHPSLGSTPFTAEFGEAHHPPDADPVSAIRRMSLTEKIAFFT